MDYVKLKLKNDMDCDSTNMKKMSIGFLKYSFICEFTQISNTSKSNSIR